MSPLSWDIVIDGHHYRLVPVDAPLDILVRSHVLTRRQQEIARLIARGCTNKEVASELGISKETAEMVHRLS